MDDLVLLVDDEPPLLARLGRILQGLGLAATALHCAGDVAQATALCRDHRFTLALVDLGLPDASGVELIRWLRARDELLPILVISAWSSEEMILEALRAGATGYVLKERDDIEIEVSIRCALKGGAPIDPFIARRILALAGLPVGAAQAPRQLPDPADADALRTALTGREQEILGLVAKGLANQEIATVLVLSRATVETHIKHVYRKLAVHSRTAAVHEARALGLLG